jgi:hypothetical protein
MSTLDQANLGPVEIGSLGELFLRDSFASPHPAEVFAELQCNRFGLRLPVCG